jgi:hypothetical protein
MCNTEGLSYSKLIIECIEAHNVHPAYVDGLLRPYVEGKFFLVEHFNDVKIIKMSKEYYDDYTKEINRKEYDLRGKKEDVVPVDVGVITSLLDQPDDEPIVLSMNDSGIITDNVKDEAERIYNILNETPDERAARQKKEQKLAEAEFDKLMKP